MTYNKRNTWIVVDKEENVVDKFRLQSTAYSKYHSKIKRGIYKLIKNDDGD